MEYQPYSSDNPAGSFVASNPPTSGETSSSGGEVSLAAPAAPRQALADDQLIVLHEVAKYLAQNRSLPETLALIAEKACFLTSSASAAVCMLDEGRETLEFAAVAGRGAAEMEGQKVRVADAMPGQTAMTGEPLLAYNPEQARRASARGKTSARRSAGDGNEHGEWDGVAEGFDEQLVRSGGVRSAAVVPIVIGAASMGSLAAINRLDGQSFTGSDLLVLQILAASASTAIQKDFLGRQSSQRERERNILFRVAQNTGASLDVQRILNGTMESLCYSVDARAVIIFLQNDDRTHLYIAAQSGLTDEQQEIQLLSDGKLARSALSGTGKALIVDEPELNESYEELLPLGGAPVQSMLVVPMNARESAVGLIVAVSRQKGAYSEEDKALLAAIGAQTALALENATLYEDATRRAGEATTIYELSQTVNSDFNLARVLSYVADSILALLQVDKFALFLYNPERHCLEIKVSRNLSRETARTMCPSPERRGIAWWVYEYETPTAVQDVAADFRNRSLPLEGDGVASLVSVPLQAGDSVIGVIHAMSSRRRAFTVAEMELLYTIANQVGIAVFNIQALAQTRRDSAELRRAFRRVVRALGASTHSSNASAQTIVDLAAEMMRAERAALLLTLPESEASGVSYSPIQLSLRAVSGMRLPQEAFGPIGAQGAETASTSNLSANWVARRGRPLGISQPGQDSRFAPAPALAAQVTRSGFYLGVPLKIGRQVIGVLEIYGRDARAVPPADEMRRYLTFASQAAIALQNSLLMEEAARSRELSEQLRQSENS